MAVRGGLRSGIVDVGDDDFSAFTRQRRRASRANSRRTARYNRDLAPYLAHRALLQSPDLGENIPVAPCGRRLPGLVRAEFGHQIACQVSVERGHRCLVGGRGAEPDKAVRPHEDSAAIGHAGLDRIEPSACSVDNRDEFTPLRAQMIQARCRAKTRSDDGRCR